MSQPSLHLTARDFDAYLAEKATSNAYTRPRIEIKQRALAWGRSVLERLSELGIAAEMHGSDEHPSLRNRKRVDCQWVFFWRDQAAREELDRLLDRGRSISDAIDDPSPYTRHAFLALRIDASAVEVCLAVHPDAKVDVDNLHARLATASGGNGTGAPPGDAATLAAEFTTALRALPEQFLIGTSPEDRVACSAVTPDAILTMLGRAAAGQVPLWIGWSVPRETATSHSDILDEQLEDAIAALGPIYRLIAWSRQNDHIALDRRIEGMEQEKARTHAEVEAQNERWRAEKAAALERSQKEARARVDEDARRPIIGFRSAPTPARRPSLDNLFKPPAGGHPPRGARPTSTRPPPPPRASASAPPPPPRASASAPPPPPRASAPPPPSQAPAAAASAGPTPIEKGTRVRVLAGAFADKVGVVSELDGRGAARVLLGLLSTRLELSDLEPVVEGRERPALQSSHRHPPTPAPRKTR